jgi:hypothetical protein
MLRAFGCREPIDGDPSLKVQNVMIGSRAEHLRRSVRRVFANVLGIPKASVWDLPNGYFVFAIFAGMVFYTFRFSICCRSLITSSRLDE